MNNSVSITQNLTKVSIKLYPGLANYSLVFQDSEEPLKVLQGFGSDKGTYKIVTKISNKDKDIIELATAIGVVINMENISNDTIKDIAANIIRIYLGGE